MYIINWFYSNFTNMKINEDCMSQLILLYVLPTVLSLTHIWHIVISRGGRGCSLFLYNFYSICHIKWGLPSIWYSKYLLFSRFSWDTQWRVASGNRDLEKIELYYIIHWMNSKICKVSPATTYDRNFPHHLHIIYVNKSYTV